jgi:hypothetical protein
MGMEGRLDCRLTSNRKVFEIHASPNMVKLVFRLLLELCFFDKTICPNNMTIITHIKWAKRTVPFISVTGLKAVRSDLLIFLK